MFEVKKEVNTYLDKYLNRNACILYSYACILGKEFENTLAQTYTRDPSILAELRSYVQDLVEGKYYAYNANTKTYTVIKSPYLENTTAIELEVTERLQEYRSIFNIKQGWMGDKQSCIKKLVKWLKTNPQYNFDDVVKAAEHYLSVTNSTYVQRADYFIEKNNSSSLSAFIEDMDTNGVEDWTKTIL